jgi:toxin ParE1/3/4
MNNFVFAPQAEADVLEIWDFIADDDSEAAADRVIARIFEECEKLGDMPGLGHRRENLLSRQYRFWRVWSYLIVYRWQITPIQIIAIVHGARDLNAFLSQRHADEQT